ncbi:MAG: helix-turn-helix domain-containing protein [Lachnospiraceae bacterium]|nr:helix-turn-helix domain-containing protein [Lachnospiraceae bacterium]
MDLLEIGCRIKAARKKEKLTQEMLAELANVSPHYIYEIEQGRKTMSLQTLEQVSSALHLSLDYLFWGDSERTNEITADSMTKADGFDRVIDSLSDSEKAATSRVLGAVMARLEKQ